jgi:hypothetical protein
METNKTIAVFENMHIGKITCAVFAGAETLITGGEDSVKVTINLDRMYMELHFW